MFSVKRIVDRFSLLEIKEYVFTMHSIFISIICKDLITNFCWSFDSKIVEILNRMNYAINLQKYVNMAQLSIICFRCNRFSDELLHKTLISYNGFWFTYI